MEGKGGGRKMVLSAVLLCTILMSWGSVLLAQQGAMTAPEVKRATIFDPFALRTVVVTQVSPAAKPGSLPGSVTSNPHRAPRVPFRLPVRSAFKPGQG